MESLSLLPLVLLIITLLSSSAAATSPESTNTLILTACKPTTHPSLCATTLSSYASTHPSPRQLANAALAVSASRARDASAYVARFSASSTNSMNSVAGANTGMQDCVVMMADNAIRLRRAAHQLQKLGRAGRPAFNVRLGDVKTWVSAALTDHVTCLASLTEGVADKQSGGGDRMRWAVKKKVAEVSRFTSNALSLVNRLGPKN